MICKEFDKLSVVEKTMLIGELVHSVQNDGECFEMGMNIINLAQRKGIFEGVKILPDQDPEY